MTAKEQREARLAVKLRENLKRRKVGRDDAIRTTEEKLDPGSNPG